MVEDSGHIEINNSFPNDWGEVLFPESLKTTKQRCVVAREASSSMIFRTLKKLGPRRSGKHNVVAVFPPPRPKRNTSKARSKEIRLLKKAAPKRGADSAPEKGNHKVNTNCWYSLYGSRFLGRKMVPLLGPITATKTGPSASHRPKL